MKSKFIVLLFTVAILVPQSSKTLDQSLFWVKVKAADKFQRSVVANTGAAIHLVQEDYVLVTATLEEKKALENLGWVQSSHAVSVDKDFPPKDSEYHNYDELTEKLKVLAQKYPNLVQMNSAGKSLEGRDIWAMRVSGNLNEASQLPGSVFMGGHHAREHLSVETPLRILEWMLGEYSSGNPKVVSLLNSRDVHFIPAVNPDGLEFDISTGSYKLWRKNRKLNSNGTYGVDLNRNYSFGWGTGGSSTNPGSDTYMGPSPFSEPESQAIKAYVEGHENISILLSFHTYSKLILYPWGGKYDPIADQKDRDVHITMAKKMSEWNGYKPQQTSELYIASGDTTDWSYGQHRIFSFTFELDPASGGAGQGFYPGAAIIPEAVNKNKEPVLYLIAHSDNPYRVLNFSWGF